MGAAAATAPTFRLGLSLAGAVSAGTYTAGALDYFVEALDAWQEGRAAGDAAAPDHLVVLDAIAGASAGAYGAALLAIGLRSRFPHMSLSGYADPPDCLDNPLYAAWVRGTGVEDLLQNRDDSDVSFKSLLDGTRIVEVADLALATPQRLATLPGNGREWVADPLRVTFTVTNVQGIPFRLAGMQLPDALANLRQFADVTRFALAGLGGAPTHRAMGDELPLAYPNSPAALPAQWRPLALAATASAAFPVVLPARVVDWFTNAYRPLRVPVPPCNGGPAYAHFDPMWPPQVPATMAYVGVDGGVLDNDPVAVVEDDLYGRDPAVRRCRAAGQAPTDRAVLMIHPLVDHFDTEQPPSASPAAIHPPHRLVARLAGAVWAQARENLKDFALAQDDACYRRFVIAPTGAAKSNRPGDPSVAGACLGGFGGYLHDDYRRHDWQLGRSHAREALRTHLTLPAGHPLFANWTSAQRKDFTVPGPKGNELPIIPLMPQLLAAPELPLPWPVGRTPLADLGKPLGERLAVVVKGLSRLYLPRCPVGRWLILLLWWAWLGRLVRGKVLAAVDKTLRANGL